MSPLLTLMKSIKLLWNAPFRDQSLFIAWEGGRVLARDPMVKGETREGGGSGVTDKTQREDRKISDKIRCIIYSTQNDYVVSRVQINLHRTQIKKEIKDRNMREIKPFLPLKHYPSVFLMEA